ncbi:MAG: hypothetical protein FJ148_07255 [Deltaproteobacteria bacterium]|nr:hypothetical protein [Deltaproteobacteria bacterium]
MRRRLAQDPSALAPVTSFDSVTRIDRSLPIAVTSHQTRPGPGVMADAMPHTVKGASDGQVVIAAVEPSDLRIVMATSNSSLLELVLATRHPNDWPAPPAIAAAAARTIPARGVR